MEDAAHSPPPSILLGRPFMKTAQTKIDMAKGALTMAFDGDMIHFKIPESNVNLIDVRSCFAIDIVPNRIQAGGNDYIDLRMLNAPIGKDYYPLPFIEPMYEYFEEHAIEDKPLYAVGPIQA
ncbi:hypothetical protein ACFX2K_028150 [Malus domestica]